MGCANSQVLDETVVKPIGGGQKKNQKGKKQVERLDQGEFSQYSEVQPIIVNDPLADVDANPESNNNIAPKSVQEQLRALIKQFFDKYDEDKSGELDWHQFQKFFRDSFFGEKWEEGRLKALMDKADTSGDQKVSQEQMCQLIKKVLQI